MNNEEWVKGVSCLTAAAGNPARKLNGKDGEQKALSTPQRRHKTTISYAIIKLVKDVGKEEYKEYSHCNGKAEAAALEG